MYEVETASAARPEALVPGRIEHRPWGPTLAAIGLGGRSGQLTLKPEGGKAYQIAFAHGVVVGATSPVPADTVARVAVTSRLATAGQVSSYTRGRGAKPDDLDALVQAIGLAPAQVQQLKHRLLVQRAARTFAAESGELVFEDHITIPIVIGVGVDVRAVIYQGARLVLDSARLAAELRAFGTRFMLTASEAEVAKFEFGDEEQPILASLRAGTSGPELEARHRELDPRMVQAVLYALASCGAVARLSAEMPAAPRAATAPARAPAAAPGAAPATAPGPRTNRPTPPPDPSEGVPMLIRQDPEVASGRERRPSRPPPPPPPAVRAEGTNGPRVARARAEGTKGPRNTRLPTTAASPAAIAKGTRRWTEPFLEVRPTTLRPNALTATELRGLISEGNRMLELGVDHFTMLGVPIGASVEAVRTAYIELARNLKPERLRELGIRDQDFHARALLAQISIAYTALTEPQRRAEYIAGLRKSTAPWAAMLDFSKLAAEAFQRGERALRADDPELAVAELRTACELAPDDIDYLATLGRAEFCAAALKRR